MVANFVDFEKFSTTIPDLTLTLWQVSLDFLDLGLEYNNFILNSSSDFGCFYVNVINYLIQAQASYDHVSLVTQLKDQSCGQSVALKGL